MKTLSLELNGTSHSEKISVTIKGLPLGLKVNPDFVYDFLARRKASLSAFSTKRIEPDQPVFTQGIENNTVTGDVVCDIYNTNVKRADYNELKYIPRPSHADYSAYTKYGLETDMSGGGAFSGRLTSLYCVAGGIAKTILNDCGIKVASYISQIGSVKGVSYKDLQPLDDKLLKFSSLSNNFPLLDDNVKGNMFAEIEKVASNGDSVGGIIETVISGNTLSLGNNFFDNLESAISYNVFSVPAVKGIEFGKGFSFVNGTGKSLNDEFYYDNGSVKTYTNNNGGINGGIANGMPICFATVIKPTPSISLEQRSVDLSKKENVTIKIKGRHDACIVPRACAVIEAVTTLALADVIISEKKWKG